MSTLPSVANMVLHALGSAGARTVFGLPGTHNAAFWKATPDLAVPRLVSVRHEQTAVYAADGWARASGLLGAAVVTTGPGAANTMAAFGEAAMSGSPVVLVASEVPRYVTDAGMRRTLHQSKDQASMFSSLAKAVFKPRSPHEVGRDLAQAIAAALDPPRGPVYIDVPADTLRAPAVSESLPLVLAPHSLDGDAIGEAARVIGSAGSVAIWVGGGVVAGGAEGEVAALAEHLQAPVVTTFGARGALGWHNPCDVVLPPHEPEVEEMLAGADVLIAIGTDFDGMMTKNARLRLPRIIIDVNVDLERTSFGYPGVLPVLGDARAAALALLRATKKRHQGLVEGLPVLRDRVWSRLRSDPRTREAAAFVRSVEGAAAGAAVVVNDMTIPGYWLGSYYQPTRSRMVQYPVGWGTLGYALPASIGTACSSEQPVLAVCGDGGFMFAVGELATIAQEQLAITVLLVNDWGYGMLRYGHDATGQRVPGADLGTPDFLQLAAAFGIEATKIDQVGAPLEAALRQSLARRRPQMIICDVSLFPPKTTSPRWGDAG